MSEDLVGERSGGEGGKTYQSVKDQLLSRLADGTYPFKSFLPPQRDLADEFEVSRDTVQKVLRELAHAGWIESKRGSGSRVIRQQRPISSAGEDGPSLGEFMDEVFSRPEVVLDVFTLSSESLANQIHRQHERIRAGECPNLRRVALRLLLPTEDLVHQWYPRAVDAAHTAAVWARLIDATRGYTAQIQVKLHGLKAEGLVPSVDVEIRHVRNAPMLKLYLVNGSELLSAPYMPVRRAVYLLAEDAEVEAIDAEGIGATYTHDVKDTEPTSRATVEVTRWQTWFDAAWELLPE
ncbi:winged helix-turn-helix domain-containing protein [Streptomyces canus]|uniref:winged helix-turn-helix domain-containing protein n=1 Tax=Streptomyces canus TaxID=58343 RepID=UPI0037129025